MTKKTDNPTPTDNPTADSGPDPREGLGAAIEAVAALIEGTREGALGDPTPCAEFAVRDLLDHVVMVIRRVAAIGDGAHWSSIEQEPLEGAWASEFGAGAKAAEAAWADPAKLGQLYEVPWGDLPGAPLLFTYTAELSVHAWDLATATGQTVALDDDLLGGALMAAKMIPAEGRGPEVPFDPVVDPGPDAPVLDQLAGWMGRPVVDA